MYFGQRYVLPVIFHSRMWTSYLTMASIISALKSLTGMTLVCDSFIPEVSIAWRTGLHAPNTSRWHAIFFPSTSRWQSMKTLCSSISRTPCCRMELWLEEVSMMTFVLLLVSPSMFVSVSERIETSTHSDTACICLHLRFMNFCPKKKSQRTLQWDVLYPLYACLSV